MQPNQCIQAQYFMMWKGLCEHVSSHDIHGDIINMYQSPLDGMTYEMVMDVYVFYVGVILIILCDRDHRDVIEVDGKGLFKWSHDLSEECVYPQCLFHSISCHDVLSLRH